MEEHINGFKAVVTAILTALTALWGWFGWLVVAWVGLMVIDYVTGSMAAAKAGQWSSAKAREGIWHKTGCIFAVVVAGVLDLVMGQILGNVGVTLPFTYSVLLCPLVLIWYVLTEAGSIVENAGALGADIPPWLSKLIAAFRDKVDVDSEGKGP